MEKFGLEVCYWKVNLLTVGMLRISFSSINLLLFEFQNYVLFFNNHFDISMCIYLAIGEKYRNNY